MVKYAHKISRAMGRLTQALETRLGPDTADLLLRIGIHSGPVTAGVIRGEKARFQLFGKIGSLVTTVPTQSRSYLTLDLLSLVAGRGYNERGSSN